MSDIFYNYAKSQFGPNCEFVLLIADAIKDGHKLPVVSDSKAVTEFMEDSVSASAMRRAEELSQNVVEVWVESLGDSPLDDADDPNAAMMKNIFSAFSQNLGGGSPSQGFGGALGKLGRGASVGRLTEGSDGPARPSQSSQRDMQKLTTKIRKLNEEIESTDSDYHREELERELDSAQSRLTSMTNESIQSNLESTVGPKILAKAAVLGEGSIPDELYDRLVSIASQSSRA